MANLKDLQSTVLSKYMSCGIKPKSKKESEETLLQLLFQLEGRGQGNSFLAKTYRQILHRGQSPAECELKPII